MIKEKQKNLIQNIYNRYVYDMIPSKAAEVSFYLLLSFFPFLIFTITLISYIPFIQSSKYVTSLSSVMPSNAYNVVSYIIDKCVSGKSIKLLGASFFIMMWSSTSGVTALIRGINKAYDQEETRPYWNIILISLMFTLEIVLLIVFSIVLIVFGRKIGVVVFHFMGISKEFLLAWTWFRYIVSLITMILIFTSLYLYTPNNQLHIKQVLPGAAAATISWVIASLAFSYYANNYINYGLLYGSIGGIIALLSWIYLSSVIILIGAEINAALHFKSTGKVKMRPIRY